MKRLTEILNEDYFELMIVPAAAAMSYVLPKVISVVLGDDGLGSFADGNWYYLAYMGAVGGSLVSKAQTIRYGVSSFLLGVGGMESCELRNSGNPADAYLGVAFFFALITNGLHYIADCRQKES